MKDILVSIITITYNAEREILATVRSLRGQLLPEEMQGRVEHLIIDGASTDATVAIARREGMEGNRIVSEPDNGLYDAMNKGLRMAKGKYVLFLNAGDSFHTAYDLAAYMQGAQEGYDIIYSDTMIVNQERRILRLRHKNAPQRLTRKSLLKGMLVCHQAFMVRKELAPEYDLRYRFSADYDWEVKCVGKTTPEKCLNLQRFAIEYLSDGLTDRNKKESLKERFRIMADHYGWPAAIGSHIIFVAKKVWHVVSTKRKRS